MEYFGSSFSLREFIESGKNTLENSKKIIVQLIDTVAYIHKLKISHGDLNVDNVLINPNTFQIKIIDFGLSKIIGTTFNPIVTPNGNVAYRIPFDLECFPNMHLQDYWGLNLIILSLLMGFDVRTKQLVELIKKVDKNEPLKDDLVESVVKLVKKIQENREENQCFPFGIMKMLFII